MKSKNFTILREKLLLSERSLIPIKTGKLSKRSNAFRIALGFPNAYKVGMSNLGFQTIYRLLNQMDGVVCERFFLFDFPPYKGTKTLESDRDIKDFDLIAFSVPFELDYPNVLQLLKSSHLPLLSAERRMKSPLVIAGGVAPTLNPEILAPFMDCILIGEAEEMIVEFMEQCLYLQNQKMSKEELLLKLTRIKGVYIPQFYEVDYCVNGDIQQINIRKDAPQIIERRSVNLSQIETFSSIITPHTHFKDSLLIEVSRGCIWGCRFCAAGYINQPCRFHKEESILSQVKKYSQNSKHIGLIGAVISDHPELEEICAALHSDGLEIGTSSLRVDMLNPELLKILVDSGLKTLTLAPEVGTEKMWRVIKKRINREAVLKSARMAGNSLIQNLKLYFIIGLPYEDERDIDGIVELIHDIHKIFMLDHERIKTNGERSHIRKKVTLSINPFIPKPHTPFQWCAMNLQEELKGKLKRIEAGIKNLKGVHLEKKSLREAILQGIFSLGNRKVGMGMFYRIAENSNYHQAWKKAGVDPNCIVFKAKALNSTLPWDLIDIGVEKSLLLSEFEKAKVAASEYKN
jgi:radical SAM superfamily enzyme YgiQ (UPF0313 family)